MSDYINLHDSTDGTTDGAGNNVIEDLRLLRVGCGQQLTDLENAYSNAG